jgi:hypothetical protein
VPVVLVKASATLPVIKPPKALQGIPDILWEAHRQYNTNGALSRAVRWTAIRAVGMAYAKLSELQRSRQDWRRIAATDLLLYGNTFTCNPGDHIIPSLMPPEVELKYDAPYDKVSIWLHDVEQPKYKHTKLFDKAAGIKNLGWSMPPWLLLPPAKSTEEKFDKFVERLDAGGLDRHLCKAMKNIV